MLHLPQVRYAHLVGADSENHFHALTEKDLRKVTLINCIMLVAQAVQPAMPVASDASGQRQ